MLPRVGVLTARQRWVARVALIGLILALPLLALPTTARAARPPESRWFWLQHAGSWQHIRAVALASRRHVTVFAPAHTVTTHQADVVAEAFEQRIYPTDTSLFGLPRLLGKVIVLLAPLDGLTLGYFNETDLRPSGFDAVYSNHGNILYVRLPGTMPDADRLADVNEVVAHEFQHLLEFRLREMERGLPRQDDWLNEGLSFYAQVANHYFTPRDRLKVRAAASEPTWQITGLTETNRALLQHGRVAYGRAGLFATYLGTRFGSHFIRDLVVDPRTGIAAIDDLLRPQHLCAGQAFADWGVASLVDAPGVYGYGPLSSRLRATPRSTLVDLGSAPYDSENSYSGLNADPWSHRYIRLSSPRRNGTLHVAVDAPIDRLRVALVLRMRGSLVPEVRWFHADGKPPGAIDVPNFGKTYYEANVVVSDVSAGARPDHYRVRASLLDMSYNNGVP